MRRQCANQIIVIANIDDSCSDKTQSCSDCRRYKSNLLQSNLLPIQSKRSIDRSVHTVGPHLMHEHVAKALFFPGSTQLLQSATKIIHIRHMTTPSINRTVLSLILPLYTPAPFINFGAGTRRHFVSKDFQEDFIFISATWSRPSFKECQALWLTFFLDNPILLFPVFACTTRRPCFWHRLVL